MPGQTPALIGQVVYDARHLHTDTRSTGGVTARLREALTRRVERSTEGMGLR